MENKELIVEQPNSFEISINAKGLYAGKIKVYAQTIGEAYHIGLQYAQKLEELIFKKNFSGVDKK